MFIAEGARIERETNVFQKAFTSTQPSPWKSRAVLGETTRRGRAEKGKEEEEEVICDGESRKRGCYRSAASNARACACVCPIFSASNRPLFTELLDPLHNIY